MVIDAWRALGEKIGLANTGKVYCNWSQCQWHKAPATVPLQKCSGCETVTYCSRGCQTKDWPGGHKAKCTKIPSTKS